MPLRSNQVFPDATWRKKAPASVHNLFISSMFMYWCVCVCVWRTTYCMVPTNEVQTLEWS